MGFVYLETKQLNHKNELIRRGCFFHMFCIKITHFDTHGS